MLYVVKNFRFDRYSVKVVPKSTPALTKNILSVYLHLGKDNKNKSVSVFSLCFISFETIKNELFWIKLILLKIEQY